MDPNKYTSKRNQEFYKKLSFEEKRQLEQDVARAKLNSKEELGRRAKKVWDFITGKDTSILSK